MVEKAGDSERADTAGGWGDGGEGFSSVEFRGKVTLMTPSSLAVPASIRVAPGEMKSLDINPGTPVALMIISNCLSFVKSSPL